MAKTHEDRLQEAIEDALDDRAILLMPDWRHPITAVSALHKLIKRKQRAAWIEGAKWGYKSAGGHNYPDDMVFLSPYDDPEDL